MGTRIYGKAAVSLVVILAICFSVHALANTSAQTTSTVRISTRPADVVITSTTTTTQPPWGKIVLLTHTYELNQFYTAVAQSQAKAAIEQKWRTASQSLVMSSRATQRPYTGQSGCVQPQIPTIPAVMACVKACESGDYTNHTHPGSGSGAYQFTPGTWRTWSARTGHPGYAYAYLAPPWIQDDVFIYTITHGGAHNWDPKYGTDPCTLGLP